MSDWDDRLDSLFSGSALLALVDSGATSDAPVSQRVGVEVLSAQPIIVIRREPDDEFPEVFHHHVNGGGLVQDTAEVADTALVSLHAVVKERAKVLDHACVINRAVVTGNAVVSSRVVVSGQAYIGDDAQVCEGACVGGDTEIFGRARIDGDTVIGGRSYIGGSTHLKHGTYQDAVFG